MISYSAYSNLLNKVFLQFNRKVVFFILFAVFSSLDLSAQAISFDKVKWNSDIKYRNKFVKKEDFRKLLIGKSNIQVVDLLGEPEKKDNTSFIYCLDKKTILIADCKENNENCIACNSTALAIIFSENSVIDIITP